MKEISINTDYITLGQLLKMTGIAYSGSNAKQIILSGAARVNGEVVTQRGKKLRKGDKVSVENEGQFIIV